MQRNQLNVIIGVSTNVLFSVQASRPNLSRFIKPPVSKSACVLHKDASMLSPPISHSAVAASITEVSVSDDYRYRHPGVSLCRMNGLISRGFR